MEGLARNFEPAEDVPDTDDAADTPDRPAPLKAVLLHCLDCCGGNALEVRLCISNRCALWTLRAGHKPDQETLAQVADVLTHPTEHPMAQAEVAAGSRLKAIRRRCLDCAGGSIADVRSCATTSCDLHPYRLGKSGRTYSPEQREAMVARARTAFGRPLLKSVDKTSD